MSSEQLKAKMAAPKKTFGTFDFYLACFLRFNGYELLDLRAEGRRKEFIFPDRPSRRADVLSFYSDTAVVAPRSFSTIIRDMKALLHNA